jgi:hypothetical protein
VSDVYGFRGGPALRGLSSYDMLDGAMEQPLSPLRTVFDQVKGGILESFGLGTAIRGAMIPEGTGEGETLLQTAGRNLAGAISMPIPGVYPLARAAIQSQINPDQPAMAEDEWRKSPYFRPTIKWDASMTQARAEALAEWDDAKQTRQFYAAKRPISAFIGNLAGQALDPINYIPIAGPAVKAAAVARMGRIAGSALTGAVDAAANTAIFGLATAPVRGTWGDDVSWQATVSEIATAALIGSAFGGVSGALEARTATRADAEAQTRLSTLKTTQEARIALNEAIDAVIRGNDIQLSPNSIDPIERVTRGAEEISKERPVVLSGSRPQAGNLVEDTVGELSIGTPEAGQGAPARTNIAQNIPVANPVTSEQARAALVAAGYDLKSLAESGADVPAIMRAASLEDGSRAVQVQEIAAVKRRIAELTSAKAVQNVYGPGLRRTDKAAADARVYDNGFGEAMTREERRAELVSEKAKLAEMEAAERTGVVVPRILDQVQFFRNDRAPILSQREIDTMGSRIEPRTLGANEAEARITKPEDARAIAEQHRVNPETADFPEVADIDQLRAEGRLTAEDEAVLQEAQDTFDNAAAYGEALNSVVRCLL